ncbi:hypothetical protein B0H14DRAFT_3141514 [Mycena olivaceomarginata]|nr:hypothetical protein B0H14DRAFT_3141514 [Mycena olivaceomarginata]
MSTTSALFRVLTLLALAGRTPEAFMLNFLKDKSLSVTGWVASSASSRANFFWANSVSVSLWLECSGASHCESASLAVTCPAHEEGRWEYIPRGASHRVAVLANESVGACDVFVLDSWTVGQIRKHIWTKSITQTQARLQNGTQETQRGNGNQLRLELWTAFYRELTAVEKAMSSRVTLYATACCPDPNYSASFKVSRNVVSRRLMESNVKTDESKYCTAGTAALVFTPNFGTSRLPLDAGCIPTPSSRGSCHSHPNISASDPNPRGSSQQNRPRNSPLLGGHHRQSRGAQIDMRSH